MTDDRRVVDPGHAPTPFTAAEIRRGCPEGRRVTIRNVDSDRHVTYWTTTFTACDEIGTVLVNQAINQEGTPVGEASRLKSTWDELQAHASFPVEQTTTSKETIETPLGDLDSLRYVINDGVRIRTLWFATGLPGLPVKTQEGKGEDAHITSEMLENTYL